ncbi:MAG: hydroxyphenylacetyl-CoA thioesterase PaaI [Pseudomonadales bacterium]|nr:hydroxyphenylacetyl-CoA thioesterase PaaI [Pseudomonadales bacterium]MCP5214927.1 hydroxyphenylacetyl-CoA thioesterase PaaI [Pseudomonadales bacterium]
MQTSTQTQQALAEACVNTLYQRDVASQDLGMKLISIAPGQVVMEMKITEKMLNGHKICHGGYIFALADSTFAFASNSENFSSVATDCMIDYVKPGKLNDLLTARAKQIDQGKRVGYYDVSITNQEGVKVAHFRGKSYRLGGAILDEDGESK